MQTAPVPAEATVPFTPLAGLRAAGYYAVVIPIMLLIALIATLCYPLRYRICMQWVRFSLWWLRLVCGLDHTVEGREHVPRQGTAIVACNHQSAWETLSLMLIFPPQCILVKRELLWVPILGWGLMLVRAIAVDRGGAGAVAVRRMLRKCEQRLAEGRWIALFPEGTRSTPGTPGHYRGGIGVLAARTGRPVIPVRHDAGRYWPRNSFCKRPGTIRLRIGPPIDSRGKSAEQITRLVQHWIESPEPR